MCIVKWYIVCFLFGLRSSYILLLFDLPTTLKNRIPKGNPLKKTTLPRPSPSSPSIPRKNYRDAVEILFRRGFGFFGSYFLGCWAWSLKGLSMLFMYICTYIYIIICIYVHVCYKCIHMYIYIHIYRIYSMYHMLLLLFWVGCRPLPAYHNEIRI